MVVAVTKHPWRGRKLSGNVVQLGFQLSHFRVTQSLTTQAAEVVIEEEVELPGEFCFVKRELARDRVGLVSVRSRLLNLCDERDRLFLVLVAQLFRLVVVNVK